MYRFVLLFSLWVAVFPHERAFGWIQQDTLRNAITWQRNLVGTATAAQTGYHNWEEGGVNTLAFTGNLSGKAVGTSTFWKQTHDLRLGFGQVKQDTMAFRKSEDVIRYSVALQYQGSGPLDPTAAFDLRTQFAAGFNYDRNPFRDGRPLPVKVSDWFAPATLTQSLGLTYDPNPWLKTRLGVAARETIVLVPELRPLYNVEPGRFARYEVGIESRTEIDREIFHNVALKSRLGLFAAFNRADMPDALWENLINMQVNTWLGVKFEFVTYYKRELATHLQFKQVLAIAISYHFLR